LKKFISPLGIAGFVTLLLFFSPRVQADGLPIEEAIRSAWKENAALAGSRSMVEAAQAEANGAKAGKMPSLLVSAQTMATKEPVAAFGMKLDQQRITAADFDPARLNSPDWVGGVGLGISLFAPLYMGGRLSAFEQATSENAKAEEQLHQRRLQTVALNVVQAYFGTLAAMEGVRYAEDLLAQAQETERFLRSRNEQGMVLDADLARATAFRAQAESELISAKERQASARTSLALLTNRQTESVELSTPLWVDPEPARLEDVPNGSQRADLQAAHHQVVAAQAMATATHGRLLPEVMANATVETLRSDVEQGSTWFSLGVVANWRLSLAESHLRKSADQKAQAAEKSRRWQAQNAEYEIEKSRRALAAARARILAAREAVAAAESARTLRLARHRQGLLPLTEVLDAESSLAGARALLLRSQFETRVAQADIEFALGQPILGVK
jgi:outer membrane protein TolC